MVPIIIDISGLVAAYSLTDEQADQFMDNVMGDLAVEFSEYWKNAAKDLASTRKQYQRAVYVEKLNSKDYIVGLAGQLPNMLESGSPPFDIKEGLKKSPKYTKDGKMYINVPFRFATSGALGESSIFSGKLPSKIEKAARVLPDKKALSKKGLPKELRNLGVRDRVITKSRVFEEYRHKNSIYEGLSRRADSANRGQYMTFRRVSENSDPDSWIHPGFEAKRFAERAFDNMNFENTLDAITDKYMGEL